ncbi:hypothetical protein Sjap_002877 [Stephania japonica]|uniref:Uncharacterized protein n=1 Tax=Stephania japonica TaxID=461633 RepID=A0AAP0KMN5_9MAGN
MMWSVLAVMKRNICGKKNGSRVADESMVTGENRGNRHHHHEQAILMHDVHMMGRPTASSHGFSFICTILRSPFTLFSCMSYPDHHHVVNGGAHEGALWLSGMARTKKTVSREEIDAQQLKADSSGDRFQKWQKVLRQSARQRQRQRDLASKLSMNWICLF